MNANPTTGAAHTRVALPPGEVTEIGCDESFIAPFHYIVLVTTAEMLRAEGEARGFAEGFAKGLVHVLAVKFGPLPGDVVEKVHATSSSQVEAWIERFVTADTLDQTFS